jgi:hypothetical protein
MPSCLLPIDVYLVHVGKNFITPAVDVETWHQFAEAIIAVVSKAAQSKNSFPMVLRDQIPDNLTIPSVDNLLQLQTVHASALKRWTVLSRRGWQDLLKVSRKANQRLKQGTPLAEL